MPRCALGAWRTEQINLQVLADRRSAVECQPGPDPQCLLLATLRNACVAHDTCFFSNANGLSPSQVCIELCNFLLPSNVIESRDSRTDCKPIQMAVIVFRSVDTYKSISNPGSDQQRSTSPSGATTSHQSCFDLGRSRYRN